jgi:hypothetical protein
MRRALYSVLVLAVFGLPASVLLAGCYGNDDGPPSTGQVAPTVAGGAQTAGYGGYQQAKQAFTRGSEDGVLIAVLEDVTWLKYEGSAEDVEKDHPGYFEHGYTTFEVTLRAREFTRPTEETYVLEDSNGARATAKPLTYKGGMMPVSDRWQFEFNLSFSHAITKDTRWIRLTRVKDGEAVMWTLGGQ